MRPFFDSLTVRLADNTDDECLIVVDQLLRVRGTLEEVTEILREG